MTILVDRQVRERLEQGSLVITDPVLIGPASVDLTLGEGLLLPRLLERAVNPQRPPAGMWTAATVPAGGFLLRPGKFLLATVEQRLTLPDDLAGQVEGCSTNGRCGLLPHTAGFVDPGFDGYLTLELYNVAPWPLLLTRGMVIAQLVLLATTAAAAVPYGQRATSRYQAQAGVTAPRAAGGLMTLVGANLTDTNDGELQP